jgi:UDP-N-acetylglucosamine:LPS N-acetylglucosamine transferase
MLTAEPHDPQATASADDERSTEAVDSRPLVLVTLNGGGWHRQTRRILSELTGDEFRFAYVGGASVRSVENDLDAPHPGARFVLPNAGQTNGRWSRRLRNAWRLLEVCWRSWRLVRRLRPAGIIAVGTPNAIPLFCCGRLFGARCVFVESLTRMQTLSRTGRILYRLGLAHRLYVQWPRLRDAYPRTVFAGAVV